MPTSHNCRCGRVAGSPHLRATGIKRQIGPVHDEIQKPVAHDVQSDRNCTARIPGYAPVNQSKSTPQPHAVNKLCDMG